MARGCAILSSGRLLLGLAWSDSGDATEEEVGGHERFGASVFGPVPGRPHPCEFPPLMRPDLGDPGREDEARMLC